MEYPRLNLEGADLPKGVERLLGVLRRQYKYAMPTKSSADDARLRGMREAFQIVTGLDEDTVVDLLYPNPTGGAR